MESTHPGSRRLTFSLAALFVVVTLAALAARWPRLLMLAVPALPLLLTLKFASPTVVETSLRYGLVLAAVYVPAAPGFFLDCGHCRQVWREVFLMAPGIVPALLGFRLLGLGRLPDWVEFSTGGVIVCIAIAALYLLGVRGKIRLAVAVVLGLAGSAFACFVFAALLRA